MVKESDMELMNWLCPECGLELHKHLISIDCPVSDVDVPAECEHCGYPNDTHPRTKCWGEPDAPEPAEELSQHVDSPDCWCEPELNYEDPDSGNRLWVHRERQ